MDDSHDNENLDILRYFYIALAWWWVFLLFLLIGAGGAVLWYVLTTPVYRAVATYELAKGTRVRAGDSAFRDALPRYDQDISRQIFIMQSPVIRQKTSDRLLSHEAWDRHSARPVRINVRRISGDSEIAEIQVDAEDKEYALAFLEEMLNSFRQYQRDYVLRFKDQSLTALDREKRQLYEEVQNARGELSAFEREHNIRFSQTKTEHDESFLRSLVQRRNAIRMEKTMLRAQFPFLEDADASLVQNILALNLETHLFTLDDHALAAFQEIGLDQNEELENTHLFSEGVIRGSWGEDASWKQRREQLIQLQAEYEEKLNVYQKNHPRMIELKNRIKAARRNLELTAESTIDYLRNRHEALEIQEISLAEATENWRRELDLTREHYAQYQQLIRNVEHYENLYDKVYGFFLESSLIDTTAMLGNALQEPSLLANPVVPNRSRIISISFFLALSAAVGAVYLLDQYKSGVLNVSHIENSLNLQYLTSIPKWENLKRDKNNDSSRIVIRRDNHELSSEIYRNLRDSVLYSIPKNESYILMISSGVRNTGKSLTSINLAIACSWTGKKVLLIDGDLRRGKLCRDFKLEHHAGLAEIIRGEKSDWLQLINKTDYENLDLLQPGSYSHVLPDLISPHLLEKVFSQMRRSYDLIIVDTAPLNPITDSTIFSRACDSTLLLIDYEQSSYHDIKMAAQRVYNKRIIGFCLNYVSLPRNRYQYYRYRNYYPETYHTYSLEEG